MNGHLITIAVGPVQEFISAARRTRDLWFGSYLLSEVSKATAKAVSDAGGELIFPAADSSDLEPGSSLNIANIILATLPEGCETPQSVIQKTKAAAESRWKSFAGPVLKDYGEVIQAGIWNDQVDDVIEFYAAWICETEDYQADRRRVMRLLAGRKNCRDFRPAKGRAGIPKSSLDGLRESVLRDEERPPRSRRSLRVTQGEQLDVVALVKRTAEGHRPYPSVSRVAADPWIRGIANVAPSILDNLVSECKTLGGDVLHQLSTTEQGHSHFAAFPFEGTSVFRSRHHELWEETCENESVQSSRQKFQGLEIALADVTRRFGEPNPYLAVLVADGDRMGQAISKIPNVQQHQQFSRSLAEFAGVAKTIVHQHQGILVYAGGDDVLAFLPVDQCLKCARELHDSFGERMQEWSTPEIPLTLSAGIALAHFMENLEDLLDFGRAAEKHAKTPHREDGPQAERDGLAVHLRKRGGGPIEVRDNWPNEIDLHLLQLADWINQRAVSGRVAYDLHQIAAVYDNWPADTVGDAIQGDTLSILRGKQPRGESKMQEVEQFIRETVRGSSSLRQLADELLVARMIAAGLRQAAGVPVTASAQIGAS